MRVVVTGGSGRIGSYLVRELAGCGHEVVVFDRLPPPAVQGLKWVRADIEDFGEVILNPA